MTGGISQAARVKVALNAELVRALAIHEAIGTMLRPRDLADAPDDCRAPALEDTQS